MSTLAGYYNRLEYRGTAAEMEERRWEVRRSKLGDDNPDQACVDE